ncbi:MAG: UDP-2,3-diacylglucosamine diphosphatase [bacterium]|nr:UDP-2,3-diacylglucosamine diphosphatase [bacterium]
MSVAAIADAHLGGPGGAASPLADQIDALRPDDCERLILLGDLFQVWVGSRRFETPEIALVVDSLQRLRDRGVPTHYIEGNRDFFLRGSEYEAYFDSIGAEFSFETCGRRYLVVHGDGLNARDYLYRFWRRFSKNRLSRLGMLGLPRTIADLLIQRAEHGLSKTNFKHKTRIPEEVLLAYGRKRLSEGYDELLLGHFHERHDWEVPEGRVRILDAWFATHAVEWIPGEFRQP